LTSLRAVISEILQSRDFQVSDRDGFLAGKRKEVEVVFLLMVDRDDKAFSDFMERFKEFKGKRVIATLLPLPDTLLSKVDERTFVWDRQAIEHEIGRVHIEKIVGERDHGLMDEFGEDDYPKMVTAEDLEKAADQDFGEKIVKPIVDVEDVKQIAAQTVAGFRHRLELVPHYVFSYKAPLYIDENKLGIETGLLAVNGLTHKVDSWPADLDIVFSLEVTHKRLEPLIDTEEARNLVMQEVVKRHTFERDIVKEENHVTMTEKKTVSPKSDSIELTDMGIFYLPIWCIEGVKGVMILNASTGKIISEDYYRELS
jgi:hypothetical protein